MERKNVALIIENDEPIFFDNEDKLLSYLSEFEELPGRYTMALTVNSEAGLLYRDREWLTEQFDELKKEYEEYRPIVL